MTHPDPSLETPKFPVLKPWHWVLVGSGSTVMLFLSGVGLWTLASPLLVVKTPSETPKSLNIPKQELPKINLADYRLSSNSAISLLANPSLPLNDEAAVLVATKTSTSSGDNSSTKSSDRPSTPDPDYPQTKNLGQSSPSEETKTSSDRPKVQGSADKPGDTALDWVWNFSEGMAEVQVGDKWGYVDRTGRMLIRPQFQEARSFTQGLAAIKVDDRWGYVDRKGKVVIPPKFQEAGEFSEDFAPVRWGDKWGYIDKGGSFVVQPQYEEAGKFYEQMANVKVGDRWGYIDTAGGMVISPQFIETWGFSEGVAQVRLGSRTAYINKEGRFIINKP